MNHPYPTPHPLNIPAIEAWTARQRHAAKAYAAMFCPSCACVITDLRWGPRESHVSRCSRGLL